MIREKNRQPEGGSDIPQLSLCMIVKNEERFLEGCLESVKDVVDEIVVVDTGSTDRTPEIAGKYGARVVHFRWCDDFSAARNASLREATGEWVLYLDADERLVDGQSTLLRSLLSQGDVGAFTLLIRGAHQLSTGLVQQVNAYPRLFRRLHGVQFEGRIHEQVTPSLRRLGKEILPSSLVIEHLGYALGDDVIANKCKRNLSLLQAQLAQVPHDAYARFQLGNTYSVLGEYDEAQKQLEVACGSGKLSSSVHASALNLMAEIAIRRSHYQEAIASCTGSLKKAPGQMMARWFLAAARIGIGDFRGAITPLEEILALLGTENSDGCSGIAHDITLNEVDVIIRLAGCYHKSGMFVEAGQTYSKVLRDHPDHTEALNGLLSSVDQLEDTEEAIRILESICHHRRERSELYIPLAKSYWKAKDRPAAFELVLRTLEVEPANPDAYSLMLRWRMEDGDFAGAEDILVRAESNKIIGFDLLKCALELFLRKGDVHSAFRYLEKMAAASPIDLSPLKDRLTAIAARLAGSTG